MNPIVSIIINTFNNEKHIKNTLISIIKQTYKNIEIIVVDNSSNDNTIHIIEELSEIYTNITLVKNKIPKTIINPKNIGYGYVNDNSSYIFFHEPWDISYDNRIETLVNFLECNLSYALVGSFTSYIDMNDNFINLRDVEGKKYNWLKVELEYKRIFNTQHLYDNIILGSTLIRKNIVSEFLPFSNNLYSDYIFTNNIIMNEYKVQNIDIVLGARRITQNILDNNIDNISIKTNIQNSYKVFLDNFKNKESKRKIGVIIIGTNKYFDLVPELISSVESYFLTNEDVKIYFFTNRGDEISKTDNLTVIPIEHKPWPGMTLLRYDMIYNHKEYFEDNEYLFYIDADMKIIQPIGDEILGDLVVIKHPIYYRLNNFDFDYERNEKSLAYIPESDGSIYYYGCFQGGKTETFLKMADKLRKDINIDIKNNIITKWYDESYLNQYCIDYDPEIKLDPSYSVCGLDNLDYIQNYRCKIVAVDKDEIFIRNNENKNDFLLKENQKDLLDPKCKLCLVPWLQVSISTMGEYVNCCMSTIKYGDVLNETIDDVWNNNIVKNVRKQFMNNEVPKGCECCLNMEKEGLLSFRVNSNRGNKTKYEELIKNTDSDGFLHINKLRSIEIKYGNLCNCKCRMCGHFCSSEWFDDSSNMCHETYLMGYKYENKFLNNFESFEDIKHKIGNYVTTGYTDNITFLGGEPLINKYNNKTLQYLLDKGLRNVSLGFFTNLSYINDEFLDIVKNFKSLTLNISIDGVEKCHDYIRGYNGLWGKLLNNWEKVKSLNNCNINISPCYSIYNAYHLPDLLKFILENKMVTNDHILITPLVDKNYMNVSVLPKFFKDICIEKFNEIEKQFGEVKRIGEMCRSLLINPVEFDVELLNKFYNFTFELDSRRNENLLDVFPEHRLVLDNIEFKEYLK